MSRPPTKCCGSIRSSTKAAAASTRRNGYASNHRTGQIWRRLRIAFPPEIHTHNRVQDLYIDHDGLIARHDYAPEILGGTPAAHYLSGYDEFDWILFPTHRRVLPRGTDNRADPQVDPEPVLIGMEFAGNYTLQ